MTRHRIALQGSRLLPGQSLADPVDSSEGWRSACDVVVIGGGIVGVCTALFLADRGVEVVLIEKGVIAGEAPGRAVSFIDSAMMAREKQEAIRTSKTLWGALDRRCGGRTGYRQSGLVFAMDRAKDLLVAADWARHTTAEARILTRIEALQLMPGGASAPFEGALYLPTDGYADPRRAAPAIADLAKDAGAHLFQGVAARRILTEGRRMTGVETERGVIRCRQIVVASGIWSTLLLRPLGFEVPQLHGFATASEVAAPALPAGIGGGVGGIAFRPNDQGTHVVGPHLSLAPVTPASIRNAWRFRHVLRGLGRVIDLAPNLAHFRLMRQAETWRGDGPSPFETHRILEPEHRHYSEAVALSGLARSFASSEPPRLIRSWAGALATTPDNMPIIGSVPDHDGLHLACGMYYGFTFGPVAAAILAARVMNAVQPVDPNCFRPDRFQDGSSIRFHQ